jgi:hypothetical protein
MGETQTIDLHEGKCSDCGRVVMIGESGRCMECVGNEIAGRDRAMDLALKKIAPRFTGMFASAERHMRATLDAEGKTVATFKVNFQRGERGLAFKCAFATPGIPFNADSDLEFVDTAQPDLFDDDAEG